MGGGGCGVGGEGFGGAMDEGEVEGEGSEGVVVGVCEAAAV